MGSSVSPLFREYKTMKEILAIAVLLAIVLTWGLLKAYDLPVREWLKEHWLKR